MERRERDLGSPGEVEPVRLERVDVRSLGREETAAVHRFLADEDRGDDGREAGVREMVEGELVERHRHARGVAHDVPEACSRDTRGTLHVEASDLRVLARFGEHGWVANPSQLLGVVLRVAVGRRVVGRVRHECERSVARGLGASELVLGLLQRCLDRSERLELLG